MSEDRTPEFFEIAQSLSSFSSIDSENRGSVSSKRYPYNDPSYSSGSSQHSSVAKSSSLNNMSLTKQEAYEELRAFHGTASTISEDISATSSMLSELTQLVRRRGLFMDDTDRVNFLVLRIKNNIEGLNGRLDEVGRVIAQQKRRLGKNSQAGQEAMNLVGQLKEEFVQTTTGFKSVLQQRSDRMKEQTDRKRQVFGQTVTSSAMAESQGDERMGLLCSKPHVYQNSDLTQAPGALDLKNKRSNIPTGESTSSASQLPRPRGVFSDSLNSGLSKSGLRLRNNNNPEFPSYANTSLLNQPSAGHNNSSLTPLEIQRLEKANGNSQTLQLIPDQNYLRERADAMTQVESNIVELGTIFNKLAVMVNEHRDLVQRVEDNVDDANDSINLSMMTLTDSLNAMRTNKMLFMKVMGVLVFFIIIFTTFFA